MLLQFNEDRYINSDEVVTMRIDSAWTIAFHMTDGRTEHTAAFESQAQANAVMRRIARSIGFVRVGP